MTNYNNTHLYQITIYTPTTNNTYFLKSTINQKYNEEASSKSQIIKNPSFQTKIQTLKQQFPYTYYTIEGF